MKTTLSSLLVLAGVFLSQAIVPQSLAAQSSTLSGTVVDAQTLQPLGAVQVMIPSLGVGALSQANGRYQLTDVPAGQHTVVAERIGYTSGSREVTVQAGQPAEVNFQLEEQALALDEIVVTGTAGGTQRRAVGNVVERVAAAQIAETAPVASVEDLLGSRVPGLQTNLSSGQVGLGGAPIRIRGVSSMGVANDPIVYVDGVRMNSAVTSRGSSGATSRLNDINPEDIESIEVIKGPAAATLYGTEASNGVIQIITKRGTTGAPIFDVSAELGSNWFPDPRNTIPLGYDVDPNTGEIISAHLWDTWYEQTGERLFQRGLVQNYNLSVRGGTDLIRYFGSLNRGDSEGFVSWNWDKRTSGRLGLSLLVSDALDVNVSGAYFTGTTRSAGDNIWGTIVRQQISTVDDPMRRGFQTLITAYRDGEEDIIEVDRSTWSAEVSYNPFEWLSSRLVAGADLTDDQQTVLTYREDNAPAGHFGAAGYGRKTIDEIDTRLYNVDLSGTATFSFGRIGSATSAGLQYYSKEIVEKELEGDEFATRPLTTIGAAARTTSSETYLENTTLGVYGQQQFDWDQRIFLTVALRADDNSAFGEQFDVAIYPKVSATWVASEEGFWNTDLVQTFRLRGAWGAAGQQPDVFASSRLYQPVTGPNDLPIITMRTIGNPDLGPERGEELELGFDAAVLDGRVDLAFTQYWKTTKDAIVPAAVTPSLGFPGVQMINVGRVRNWGSELAMNIAAVQRENFAWDINLGAATMHNRVDDLGDVPFLVTGQALARQYHVEGYPLAGLWAVRVLDAEFENGNRGPANLETAMCDGGTELTANGQLGGPMGGPPVPCSEAPLVYYGRAGDPTWSVNLGSTLTLFGNWRLFASVDARGGNRITDQVNLARLTTWANALPGLLQEDPVLMAQRAIDRRPIGQYNAGFAKLREVSLNYSLPSGLARRMGASRASLNFALRNVMTLWQEQPYQDISGERVIDPEMRGMEGSGPNQFGGHSHTQLPPLKSGSIELRASF